MVQMRIWSKELELPPSASQQPRAYYPTIGKIVEGQRHLDSIIRSGNPINPVLIETLDRPGRFFSPMDLPEPYSGKFFRNALIARKRALVILGLYCLAAVFLACFFEDFYKPMTILVATMVTIMLYMVLDNKAGFTNRDILAERCRYFGWLFTASRPFIIATAGLYLFTGCLQFVISESDFLEDYGMFFDLPAGEEWRVLTGSLIHSGVAHWLTNFTLGIGISAACGPALRYYFFPIFIVGGFFSFLLTLYLVNYFSTQEHLGLVGTSGGLSALMGCQLALILRYQESYPRGFYLNIAFLFVISSVVGTMFVSTISLTCHVTGAFAGALMSLAVPNYLEVSDEGDPSLRSG